MQNIEKVLKFQIEKNDKAVLYFNSENGKEISCMIDTGANVPLWDVPVWQIPEFILTDDEGGNASVS